MFINCFTIIRNQPWAFSSLCLRRVNHSSGAIWLRINIQIGLVHHNHPLIQRTGFTIYSYFNIALPMCENISMVKISQNSIDRCYPVVAGMMEDISCCRWGRTEKQIITCLEVPERDPSVFCKCEPPQEFKKCVHLHYPLYSTSLGLKCWSFIH